ncbi:hypothetical protein D3C81_2115500 [compost metagenome]
MLISDFQVCCSELLFRSPKRVVVKVRQPQWLILVGEVENPVFLKVILALFGPDPALLVFDDPYLVIA